MPISDFGRHNESGARIYLQHWIIWEQIGFLLDPRIPVQGDSLKIADLACGTGIWLVDLAKRLPQTSQLDGFDISPAHFPSKHELPPQVILSELDSFAAVPENLVGKYDIVHCRGFSLYVADGDPGPLIENIKTMLKPGGYIHWEELDIEGMYVRSDKGPDAYPFCNKYIERGLSWMASQNINASWVSNLSTSLSQHDFSILKSERQTFKESLARPWTTMQLLATKDFIENDIIPTCQDHEDGLSPTEWREVLQKMPEECQAGARVLLDFLWVVGRKEG
ncbi:hypothetical protein HYALB_00011668 [Hymenoscyphus albidus]|uniref:Methyltransferase type 12 domain-containing protein n=1 Tax=Hymenoscyphus albidus TaxID=595503 RepID=A0A9N9LRT1_9HELO|nr:hypothetical protein HYALB_00011668 [Hymenoscyphus albidus]